MEYLTTCYRRQGEGGCSLLLQQYLYRQVPVCFACLCTAEGIQAGEDCRDLAQRLLNWCRGVSWHRAVKKPDMWLERAGRELEDIIESGAEASRNKRGEAQCRGRDCFEKKAVRVTLLLGVGDELLILGGGQNVRLLNTSFGRGKVRELPGRLRGCLEPGAGILLATDGFLKNTAGESLGETLRLPEIRSPEQAERRLREIALRQPEYEEPSAAILLVGREEQAGG